MYASNVQRCPKARQKPGVKKHTAYSTLLLPDCLSEAKVQNGRACRTLDAAIPIKAVEQDHLDCDTLGTGS